MRRGQDRIGSPRARRGVVALAVLMGLLAAACSSSHTATPPTSSLPPTSTTMLIPAPAGLPSFYTVPTPLPGAPGTLIKSATLDVPELHGTAYRVMYTSMSMSNQPVAVTGLVIVPSSTPPAGGFPIISWGHGTNGMADKCAPSLDPATDVPLANELLDHGWEIASSDYQGEGTPGLLPFIAGASAARNVIDIVRAVHTAPRARASSNYVVWGHSEGGQTAMFALNIGPSYAPELNLKGVVAGAPPSQFSLIYAFLKTSPSRYDLLMAAVGLNIAYGDKIAPLDQVLTPAGMKLVPELSKGCDPYLSRTLSNIDLAKISKGDPFQNPAWRKVLMRNDPEDFTSPSPVPLLMIQGGNDNVIPVASTQLLAQHLCKIGQNLERWIYPGQSHGGVITPSAPDMIHWIADRFAGTPSPDPYVPTGLPGIETTKCPS